jgi:hypothetical protein
MDSVIYLVPTYEGISPVISNLRLYIEVEKIRSPPDLKLGGSHIRSGCFGD